MDAGPAEADERVALTDTAREHTAQTRLTGRYIPRPVLTKAGRAPYICNRLRVGGSKNRGMAMHASCTVPTLRSASSTRCNDRA